MSFLYGLIGIVLLTAFCLIGAFLVPQNAYWFMTPKAIKILEESGISRKFQLKDKIILGILIAITGGGFIATILFAGKQGVACGMSLAELSLRFVIFFWMVSIFDAVVLDWWMFTKTDMFGLWLKKKTGKMPMARRVDPQWDGKEIHKLIIEVVVSMALAWIFLKVG
jgi:hypothetical protein